eukprot:1161133-Pelagomonas_calceolata.AAC.20
MEPVYWKRLRCSTSTSGRLYRYMFLVARPATLLPSGLKSARSNQQSKEYMKGSLVHGFLAGPGPQHCRPQAWSPRNNNSNNMNICGKGACSTKKSLRAGTTCQNCNSSVRSI